MQDFGTKADNSPPPGGQLSAAEFNNLATEAENAVSRSGQTLSGASDTQLAQSLFLHSVKSESFQDSGAANAYVATPVSGTNGVLLPADYSHMNGAVILFKAANANTAASTLNIGQTTGTLLGSKAIVDQSGTALISGMIGANYIQLRYDSSIGAGSWVLLPWSGGGRLINIQTFSSSGTYTPTLGTTSVVVEVQAGGGGSGGANANIASAASGSGGGGAGGYAISRITSGFSGASVTIGAGGTAGTSTVAGGNGGTTTFGAFLSASGGAGSSIQASTTTFPTQQGGGIGGIGSSGNIFNGKGGDGLSVLLLNVGNSISGGGGASKFTAGGRYGTGQAAGSAGTLGAGAGGGLSQGSGAQSGAAGGTGFVTIWEYA